MKEAKDDSLRQQVYQRLRHALRRGRLGSGSAATERDLAEELGVSRTPVREALVLLMHEGLISSTGRGFSASRLSSREMSDLFEVRQMLEPAAIASTADHLSAHDLRVLTQALKEQETANAAEDVDAFIAANSSFHATWIAAVPNSHLRTLIERHDDHAQWLRHLTLHDPKVRRKALSGLRNILSALRRCKPAEAATAMAAHLKAAELALSDALERHGHDRSSS
jgi:DNA-binding GntR family transcriptional regulator